MSVAWSASIVGLVELIFDGSAGIVTALVYGSFAAPVHAAARLLHELLRKIHVIRAQMAGKRREQLGHSQCGRAHSDTPKQQRRWQGVCGMEWRRCALCACAGSGPSHDSLRMTAHDKATSDLPRLAVQLAPSHLLVPTYYCSTSH